MEKPIWLFFVVSKLMTWSIFVSEDVTRTFIWFLVIQFSRFLLFRTTIVVRHSFYSLHQPRTDVNHFL
jgi:hypothetical protein